MDNALLDDGMEVTWGNVDLTGATDAEINNCVDALQELVGLSEEIVALLSPADPGLETESLCEWLADDLRCQRALLENFRRHGYHGASPYLLP